MNGLPALHGPVPLICRALHARLLQATLAEGQRDPIPRARRTAGGGPRMVRPSSAPDVFNGKTRWVLFGPEVSRYARRGEDFLVSLQSHQVRLRRRRFLAAHARTPADGTLRATSAGRAPPRGPVGGGAGPGTAGTCFPNWVCGDAGRNQLRACKNLPLWASDPAHRYMGTMGLGWEHER